MPASLADLIGRSKVIFGLAMPAPENKAMLGRELLEKIQPGAVPALMSRANGVDH